MNGEPLIDQDLLNLWHSQDNQITEPQPEAILLHLESSYKEEERRLKRVTVREVLPSVVVAGAFAWLGIGNDDRQWTFFLASLLTLGVGGFLLSFLISQRASAAGYSDSLRSQLERSLVQLSSRAWLYRNVLWWYLAPTAIAATLVIYGLEAGRVAFGAFVAIYGAFLGLLYVANRRIGARYQSEFERVAELREAMDLAE